jgi:ABC-type sugar transport system ATPase subunit
VRVPAGTAPHGEIVVGVRPEAARLWEPGRNGVVGPLRGSVAYVEALGRETFVGVDVAGARLAVHQEGRSTLQPGDAVEFGLIPEALRFFDPGSGAAVGGTR